MKRPDFGSIVKTIQILIALTLSLVILVFGYFATTGMRDLWVFGHKDVLFYQVLFPVGIISIILFVIMLKVKIK